MFFETCVWNSLKEHGVTESSLTNVLKELKAYLSVSAKKQSMAVAEADYNRLIEMESIAYLLSASANNEFAEASLIGGIRYSCTLNDEQKGIKYGSALFLTNYHKGKLLAHLRGCLEITLSATKLHRIFSEMGVLDLSAGVTASQMKMNLNGKDVKAIRIKFGKISEMGKMSDVDK